MTDGPGRYFGLQLTRPHARCVPAAFERESHISFFNRTSYQRSRIGGVCRLCLSQQSGDHHG